jgi:hypothetical protein
MHYARAVLEEAKYDTFEQSTTEDVFYFEDNSVLGFVKNCESVDTILSSWESIQDSFLRRYALRLRSETNKSWNVYSIYLSKDECSEEQKRKVFEIEENFRSTRKLVRTGIKSRSDIRNALLPLLPIQNLLSLRTEDIEQRLRERLSPDGSNPLVELLGPKTVKELTRNLDKTS